MSTGPSFASMAKSEGKRWTLLSTAAIIVGLIAAMSVAVVIITSLKSRLLVSDRGKGVTIPRLLKAVEVRPDDLPAIVEAMSRGSANVRYAGLTFSTPDRPSADDAVNLNISFESGKVGFDWVLLAPRNIEDQEKFRTFARAHGVEPTNRSMNGVSYLRVEDAHVAKFATSVVTEMYHRPPTEPLGLFHEGFEWPQS